MAQLKSVTPVSRSNVMTAAGYINNLAVELSQWVKLVSPHERRKQELKNELSVVDAEISKHANIRHGIVKRALSFWRWAQRRKADFLSGDTKTIKTGSGSFSWKFNPGESLLYESEAAVIAEIQKLGRLDLLTTSLNREAIKAAFNAGELGRPRSFSVAKIERLVITPTDLPPITVYPDGRVEFNCG